MADERLSVAVIGVGGFGAKVLSALVGSDLIDIVGVSDKDPRVAERVAADVGVPGYNDNRSLLAETRPAAAFLCMPPMPAAELISACADRGIHVWKDLPLARDLDEGVAMVRRMEEAGVKLAVGTQRRFAAGYRRAHELRPQLGEICLARAHYLFNWGADLGWRGDRASAGGGALLELGYHALDLLVWMLGMPDEVYGVSAAGNRPRRADGGDAVQPIYDTDDTAAAIMRYVGGAMASVVTTRWSGPASEELSLHGRCGSLRADGETCVLRDPDGNILPQAEDELEPVNVFSRQADAFASSVLADANTYECSGRENLLNLAVIEAIYLSDRTGQSEQPHRLLEPHGLTVEDCVALCPAAGGQEQCPHDVA